MTTILGEHIDLIRPRLIRQPIIRKSDLPRARNLSRTKTNRNHCGRVIGVCVRLKNGAIRTIMTRCTHLRVCKEMVEDIDNVEASGWLLDNGNYLWR